MTGCDASEVVGYNFVAGQPTQVTVELCCQQFSGGGSARAETVETLVIQDVNGNVLMHTSSSEQYSIAEFYTLLTQAGVANFEPCFELAELLLGP